MASGYGRAQWFQFDQNGKLALTFNDNEDDGNYELEPFNISNGHRQDDSGDRTRRNLLGYSTEIGSSITQRSPSRTGERTIDESKPQYIIRYLKEQSVPLTLEHEAKIREIYLAKW